MCNTINRINSLKSRLLPVCFKLLLSGYRILLVVALLTISCIPLTGQETSAATSSSGPDTIAVPAPSGSQRSGMYWQFSVGSLTGKSSEDRSVGVLSLGASASYQVNNWFSAGLSAGADMLEYMALPVFVDLKLLLPVNRTYYPYLYTQSGYSFPARKIKKTKWNTSEYYGGFGFGAGAGILLPGREDFRWYIQAGYRYSELRMDSKDAASFKRTLIYYYHRPELRIGVYFN